MKAFYLGTIFFTYISRKINNVLTNEPRHPKNYGLNDRTYTLNQEDVATLIKSRLVHLLYKQVPSILVCVWYLA